MRDQPAHQKRDTATVSRAGIPLVQAKSIRIPSDSLPSLIDKTNVFFQVAGVCLVVYRNMLQPCLLSGKI